MYQTTAAGRKALVRWLTGGPQIGRERLPYIAQAFFLDAVAPEDAASVIEAMRDVWTDKLAYLEGVEAKLTAEHGDPARWPADGFHPYTALRMGIHQYRAKVAWCAETLDLLAARAVAQPVKA